jgi:hypothetical protein
MASRLHGAETVLTGLLDRSARYDVLARDGNAAIAVARHSGC